MNTSASINNFHKRTRKRKNEVVRGFKCLYPNCDKAYGSENSLSQHIRLKHPNYYKKFKGIIKSTFEKDSFSDDRPIERDSREVYFDDNCKIEYYDDIHSFDNDNKK